MPGPVTYVELAKLVGDAQLQQRVQYALYHAAATVRRTTPKASTDDEARDAWAKAQLRGPAQQLTPVMILVITHPGVAKVGKDISDEELQAVVDDLVDDFARMA